MLISPPFLLKKKASEKREKECTTFAVMADIAILVAEEYERRIKNSRKENDGAERVEGQPAVVSSVSVLAGRIKARVVGHANMEVVKRFGSEPKSQIAVAASTGFFSA